MPSQGRQQEERLAFLDHLEDARQVFLGLPFQAVFLGLEVDKKQYRHIIHDGREQGDFDDRQIAGVGEFGH